MSENMPWWMKTKKYVKSPTTTDYYASPFYKDGKALTNKEVVEKLNQQEERIIQLENMLRRCELAREEKANELTIRKWGLNYDEKSQKFKSMVDKRKWKTSKKYLQIIKE